MERPETKHFVSHVTCKVKTENAAARADTLWADEAGQGRRRWIAGT